MDRIDWDPNIVSISNLAFSYSLEAVRFAISCKSISSEGKALASLETKMKTMDKKIYLGTIQMVVWCNLQYTNLTENVTVLQIPSTITCEYLK